MVSARSRTGGGENTRSGTAGERSEGLADGRGRRPLSSRQSGGSGPKACEAPERSEAREHAARRETPKAYFCTLAAVTPTSSRGRSLSSFRPVSKTEGITSLSVVREAGPAPARRDGEQLNPSGVALLAPSDVNCGPSTRSAMRPLLAVVSAPRPSAFVCCGPGLIPAWRGPGC